MRAKPETPVRMAIRPGDSLIDAVCDGMGAVEAGHRDYFDAAIRRDIADSLDLDAATKDLHPDDNRWDYLLGHSPSGEVIAVEPHSAKEDEVSRVIRKKQAAKVQLNGRLRDGARISKWLWVSSSKVHFADTEKARRRLDQEGIEFVGTKVMAKHLPTAEAGAVPSAAAPRRRKK